MQTLIDFIGLDTEESLKWYQMALRALVVFIVALILLRIAGMRAFGTMSAFSIVISLTLGSVLSRGITGHYPFLSCIAASFALALLHRILARLSYKSKWIGRLVKGEAVPLFRDGVRHDRHLSAHDITDNDLAQVMRQACITDLSRVKEMWLERDGTISIIPQEENKA